MAYDFDLFVIGGGSGGVRAARVAASLGAKVGLAEQSRLGGTCVIRGCVPKKLMVYGSQMGAAIRHAAGYGWSAENVAFDWPTLRDRVAAEVDRLEGIYGRLLDGSGVEVFPHRAMLTDPHTVHVVGANKTITAEKILVAVGGRPMRDDNIDPDSIGIVSDDIFGLETQPDHIIVAGGGYIGIEFAHIFAGLGSKVTLVYRGDRLLKYFDADISRRVQANLEAAGVEFIPNTIFAQLRTDGEQKVAELTNGRELRADQILWAIGRKPLTDGLGLMSAGVETGRGGQILTNAQFQTNVASVFAVGDVTDRVNLTPVAIREGQAFARTQFGNTPTEMSYTDIPKAVFAQPPVGVVGLSEHEAVEAGHEIDVYESDFRPMKNVLAGSDERMYMKLIADRQTDRVLGVHMVGEESPEMIQIVGIAIKAGLTKAQFDATCALHPTAAEELVTMSTKRDG